MDIFDPKDFDVKNLKPQNVTAATAEAFLIAAGWLKHPFEEDTWLSPDDRKNLSRGKAVLHQFQRDFVRLAFMMQHLPPEFLVLLLPPAVAAKIQETVEKALEEQMVKSAEKNGPRN